ncbi:FAR1 DNA binding domain-containing protein [Tanacetum coccineum]
MVVIDEHHDHDMGESSMSRDPYDMGESSMHRDAQVDNQIVILPEHLQHPDDSEEFWPTLNGTPYWIPDVPEDEKPKKDHFYDNFNDAFKMYQVLGDLAVDTKFRKDFHKLVWNVYIGPEFMLCFESATEKQRYTQRVLDNASNGSTSSIFTALPFEKHANHSEGGVETCIIRHRDKRSNIAIDATVVLNQMDVSVTCSCGYYNRHGFLCGHVFCVFHIYGIDKIRDAYLNHHWIKNVLPAHLLNKRHRYSPCIKETDTLASQVHQTIKDCFSLFRDDTDKLSELLSMVKELKIT